MLTVVKNDGVVKKRCRTCDVNKPLSEFNKNKNYRDGFLSQCGECRRAKRRQAADSRREEREHYWKTMRSKVCSRCKIDKPIADFPKNSDRKIGITPDCRACRNARYKDPRKKEDRLDYRLKSMYGISEQERTVMFESQHGLCANRACGTELSLDVAMSKARGVVDHSHVTGKVRGLLCMDCNLQLGRIEKDMNKFLGLFEYLNKTS